MFIPTGQVAAGGTRILTATIQMGFKPTPPVPRPTSKVSATASGFVSGAAVIVPPQTG